MADEEGDFVEDAENEDRENVEVEDKPKTRVEEAPSAEKTEAQKLIEAKQRKHEEEDADRLRELEEQRRVEREKQDEELRRLKEKQAQRQKQREEEERMMEEKKQQQEEQRRQEEEARKQKAEEDKRRKQEEAERKKFAAQAAIVGGRNFVIDKEKNQGESTIDKFMNISKAKTEMALNAGELEQLKKRTVDERVKPLAVDSLDNAGLKSYAESLWKQIFALETSKYDLSDRLQRQEYDIKELNERQRQTNMKKYAAAADPESEGKASAGRHPPKVQLISKYERRTDRRTFGERKGLFEFDPAKVPKGELNKPAAKKREGWIKEKGAEEKRKSYDYAEDEDQENQQQEGHQEAEEEPQENGQQEEVAAEDE